MDRHATWSSLAPSADDEFDAQVATLAVLPPLLRSAERSTLAPVDCDFSSTAVTPAEAAAAGTSSVTWSAPDAAEPEDAGATRLPILRRRESTRAPHLSALWFNLDEADATEQVAPATDDVPDAATPAARVPVAPVALQLAPTRATIAAPSLAAEAALAKLESVLASLK